MELDNDELKATRKRNLKRDLNPSEKLFKMGYTTEYIKRGIVYSRGENYIGFDSYMGLVHIDDFFDKEKLEILMQLCKEEGII